MHKDETRIILKDKLNQALDEICEKEFFDGYTYDELLDDMVDVSYKLLETLSHFQDYARQEGIMAQ